MRRFNRAALAVAVAASMTGPCFGQAGVSVGGKPGIQAGGAANGTVNPGTSAIPSIPNPQRVSPGVSASGGSDNDAAGAAQINGNGADTGTLRSGGGTVHFGFDRTTSPELESDRARAREQDRARARGQAESRVKAQSQAGTRDGNDRSTQGAGNLDVEAGAKARAGEQGEVDANGRTQASGAASTTTR
jgi:hypothetical protein